ncbi:LPXTG cell wall anchor domain-containing protein [Corynebacterium sp. H128]|uniref:LPXTG cell wall anchor domain-containing protein n=1 Tax=unclassified Corynebacterium TaxID=2624378 RepID=UPI00309B2B42
MKRFATSVTALAVAGAMSLAVMPAAAAQSASYGSSYSIEGIAGSLENYNKLSEGLKAEINLAIQAGDLMKLVELKIKADAELAAKAEGETASEKDTDNAVANAGSTEKAGAAASLLSSGASDTTKKPTTDTKAADANINGNVTAGSTGATLPQDLSTSIEGALETGSSAKPTTTTRENETGSSANLDARTILGFTGLTLALLSFGGILSSEGGANLGSTAGSSGSSDTSTEGSSAAAKGSSAKPEAPKGDIEGGAKGDVRGVANGGPAPTGEVKGVGPQKRGVLAETGDNTAAQLLAGVLLALIAAGGFAARRKFAA